ncbi:hypothetical protein PUN28_009166 [Cardiocondyla obscurior]|uniref:Uncharacterized protein n=1 Tax=Cardiocondyla obscurior TaxID=286306 RepID=A0AAW2FU46_9HYME
MKPILYRVETYIVPETKNLSVINDLNIMKQLNTSEGISGNNTQCEETISRAYNKCEEFSKFSTEGSKLIDAKIMKDIMNETETLLDERYHNNDIIKYYNNHDDSYNSKERLSIQKTEFQASIGSQETLYPAKHFSRVNSLMSIDERSENSLDMNVNDFCRHGYKNGCSASIPSPEEVSEEIFRENWLHKIEILRDRETILREKEINLQKRERELFRKEKELRIMERLLNDKMKLVEQQLKHQQDMLVGKRLDEAARILSSDIDKFLKEKIPNADVTTKENVLKKEEIVKKEEVPRKDEVPNKAEISIKAEVLNKGEFPNKIEEVPNKIEISNKTETPNKTQISNKAAIPNKVEVLNKTEILNRAEIPNKAELLNKAQIPNKAEITNKAQIPNRAEVPKKAVTSKNQARWPSVDQFNNSYGKKEESNKKAIHQARSSSSSKKSSFSRTHSYATIRYKERPKINYDDLNSTLSGASVDSLNLRTSQWFNPSLYKKPSAFTRIGSERCNRQKTSTGKLQKIIEEKHDYVVEENKILQKVSDNISALHEKETRFQNYGLVDVIPDGNMERYSNSESKLSSYLDIEISEKNSYQSLASISKDSKDRPVSWANETNKWLQKKHHIHDSMIKPTENKENITCNTRHVAETILTKPKKKFFLFR